MADAYCIEPSFGPIFFHPGCTVIICIGCLTMLVLGIRWNKGTQTRDSRRVSIEQAPLKFLAPRGRGETILTRDEQDKLPGVAFVMPVKWTAIKSTSPKENWRTQINSFYGGYFEAIFAVESADDGAVSVIEELQAEMAESLGPGRIKLAVAGLSTTCSQKIFNMVAGARRADPRCRYVFFLDANAALHPGTVLSMVHEIEQDDDVFVATGYPFDVPPPGASLWSWTVAQFRWTCLSEFLSNRSTFVWGGAMLLRKSDLDENRYGLMDLWLKGGYSDDMLVQATAQDNGRKIATPLTAIFPNTLKKDVPFSYAWDFLMRQNFVLFTYGSAGQLCRQALMIFAYAFFNVLFGPALLLAAASLPEAALCPGRLDEAKHATHLGACVLFFGLYVGAVFVLRANLRAIAGMCTVLSPEASAVDVSHVRPGRLAASLLSQALFAPAVTMRNAACATCKWGGIYYTRRRGRIVRVHRPGATTASSSTRTADTKPAAPTSTGTISVEMPSV